jgi:succinate dehydrogenase/fumarate reductase flavoprotein subunit
MTGRVLVAGGGGAGMAAAIAARETGADVVLLESEAQVGGSTARAHGHYYAAGTRLPSEAGIEDSAEALYADYMAISRYHVEAGIVRRFADQGAGALEWLIGLGADYRVEGVRSSGPTPRSIARGDHYSGERGALAAVLERACRTSGVEIRTSARVTGLDMAGGRLTGVTAGGRRWEADAVVMATGGFARNRELLERHYPAALRAGKWLGSDAGAGCRGDAITLVFGDVYVASGVSIANCAVSGRIAGTNAAREALQISRG